MALGTFSTSTLGAVAVVLLLALPASAQTTTAQKVTAEAYFDDALRLMKSGAFNEACSKLEASQRLDPAVGTLLYLGECYEKRGRTASAWVTFRDAEALARATAQPQRAEMARVHAERLQAGLARVTVDVSDEARAIQGLQVRCGSVPIDPALAGAAVPVDPGEVVVEASAPGFATLSRTVTVAVGSKVNVSIPALTRQSGAALPAGSAAVPVAATPTNPPTPAALAPERSAESQGLQAGAPVKQTVTERQSLVWPIALGAVGVVGLGVGAVLGSKAIGNASDAKELCPNGQCTEARGESLMDSARHQAQVSNVAFAVGAAGLAAGIIVYLLDRPKHSEPSVGISPWLDQGQAGLALRGRL
jgi:serine/threonine-protein kinase